MHSCRSCQQDNKECFLHLRHMTCQLIVHSNDPNADNGVLQLANCLDVAPGLETLHLHMLCAISSGFSSGEVAGMRRHDHLKTVFMSGFRCYKAQIELACCILRNASVLEQLIIEPRITDSVWADDCSEWNTDLSDILPGVCEWAQVTSERFGKAITVLGASLHNGGFFGPTRREIFLAPSLASAVTRRRRISLARSAMLSCSESVIPWCLFNFPICSLTVIIPMLPFTVMMKSWEEVKLPFRQRMDFITRKGRSKAVSRFAYPGEI